MQNRKSFSISAYIYFLFSTVRCECTEAEVSLTDAQKEIEHLNQALTAEKKTAEQATTLAEKVAEAEKKEAIAEIKAENAEKMETLYSEISKLKDEIRVLSANQKESKA